MIILHAAQLRISGALQLCNDPNVPASIIRETFESYSGGCVVEPSRPFAPRSTIRHLSDMPMNARMRMPRGDSPGTPLKR